MTTAKTLDTYSGLAVLIALTQGLIPFISAIDALHWTPAWSLPRQLDAPLWWAVSVVVLAVCLACVALFEARKKRLGAT